MEKAIKEAIRAVMKARGEQQKAQDQDFGSNTLWDVGYNLGQAEEFLNEALSSADRYNRWKKHQG